MNKAAILQKLSDEKVIALIRADNPSGLLDCARALAEGGLTSIELTMTTPGAIRLLEKATAEMPDFLFGLGTVLDADLSFWPNRLCVPRTFSVLFLLNVVATGFC
jgi:2-dehydro-3-deoxyphosphogluconate aldolase/(4S)-4-hydroxy-2-oxoglutarate aldolase